MPKIEKYRENKHGKDNQNLPTQMENRAESKDKTQNKQSLRAKPPTTTPQKTHKNPNLYFIKNKFILIRKLDTGTHPLKKFSRKKHPRPNGSYRNIMNS